MYCSYITEANYQRVHCHELTNKRCAYIFMSWFSGIMHKILKNAMIYDENTREFEPCI